MVMIDFGGNEIWTVLLPLLSGDWHPENPDGPVRKQNGEAVKRWM